ncbi:hypothetical protein DFQ28_003213 [Apophysomyces sp. BC1034]|nr:hypothetical protein DFQ30_000064 [Apophysomyces sp. BC1015]KAG0183443.1 hypothetical protein DFQ29_004387 [Apophysomyces sp. BC1021]KAG0193809.1 hypothetical protein DFQ28_003213 [Apophysomyces sp. BC1034]
MSNQPNPQQARDSLAESTIRIKDLHEAEKKLVLLVETAGDVLSVLADDGPNEESPDQAVRERAAQFRDLASRYFSLINDVQLALRNHTRYLTKVGSIAPITSKSIPFRASVAGQQKELEIWASAVGTLRQRVETIKRIAQE